VIVAGFGFRTGAEVASLRAALAAAQHGRAPVTTLAAPLDKLALVSELAKALGLPVIAVPPDALRVTITQTQSIASLEARQTGSVAEASALAAVGLGAQLLATRHISPDRMATCAIARSGVQGPAA